MVIPSTMQTPVIIESGEYQVARHVGRGGSIHVRAGDMIEPESVIGMASAQIGRSVTVHLAQELGLTPDSVAQSLTKPLGSRFQVGESLARTRRGLRTVTSDAPITGVLNSFDATAGTATLTPEAEAVDIRGLIHGEVVSVTEHEAIIQSAGACVRGSIGLGSDAFGPILVVADRPDRELTTDGVTSEMRGAVVLAGMTVGASTIRRLAEVGARGVIVGSIAEIDVRRISSGLAEPSARSFWGAVAADNGRWLPLVDIPLGIFVTEGFGRRPITEPIFQFLADREGEAVSIVMPAQEAHQVTSPMLYLTTRIASSASEPPPAPPLDGAIARLVDPQNLGVVVTCQGEMVSHQRRDGVTVPVVQVELSNGSHRVVPVSNLEILISA